jgi:orotate phosphoribosyltransferase
MIFNEQSAKTIAQFLMQIKAIKLETHKPFTWSSGLKSPIYCDNRIILSYPDIRNHVVDHLSKEIENKLGSPDAIIGVATGAIGIGVLVANQLGVPFAS